MCTRNVSPTFWAQLPACVLGAVLFSGLFLGFPSEALGAGDWAVYGPLGGDVQSLAIDPLNPGTIFAGTGNGGVFKSTDDGKSWRAVNEGLPYETVTVLAIDPASSGTVLAATDGSGVYKTTDGGATWTSASTGITGPSLVEVHGLAMHPTSGATAYAGVHATGVFKTTDGGAHWAPVNTGLTDKRIQALVIDRSNPSRLLAGTAAGVFRTLDGGLSWMAVNSGLTSSSVQALAIDPATPSTVYAGTNGGGVFKSTDGGDRWSRTGSGLTTNVVQSITVTPAGLFAGLWGGGVCRSLDGGTSWQPVFTGSGFTATPPITWTVTGHPRGTAVVLAGTFPSGLFRSSDGGATWTRLGLANTMVAALATDPRSPAKVYAGTVGNHLCRSTDLGRSWLEAVPSLFDPSFLFTDAQAVALDPADSQKVYVGTLLGNVLKSTDGGARFTPSAGGVPGGWVRALLVDPAAPETLYAGADLGVARSADGGRTWVSSGLTGKQVDALAMSTRSSKLLYAGTFREGVFRSEDGGGSWVASSSGIPANLQYVHAFAVDPRLPDTLYAATNGGVFLSADGGRNWTRYGTGLDYHGVTALAVDPAPGGALYAGTTNSGVFRSGAGSQGWTPWNGGLWDLRISALAASPESAGLLYAGTEASGVFAAELHEKARQSLTLSRGRVSVAVEWRSPYSGESGLAFATPQKDEFGFFYFSNPDNPEVFVKVLDFGSGGALCFVGGLSDFYYRVTFTALQTGQALVFEKPAGKYVGFADNGTLKFGLQAPSASASASASAGDASSAAYAYGLEGAVPAGTLWLGDGGAVPAVPDLLAVQSLSLSGGRISVSVEWRNQYTGQSGIAFATPQRDEFGFFYFSDPDNPEVFVKVLDFGSGGALCFVGGLSDLYYKVTFQVLRTGQILVFEKAAGLYLGFADNGTLRF